MLFGRREHKRVDEYPREPIEIVKSADQKPTAAGATIDAVAAIEEVDAMTAVIGQTICIKGDVTGDEDLVVEGRIEGTVSLPKSRLTIGENGIVAASVKAKCLNVDGRIEGDVTAVENVVVTSSGRMQGNIKAPRITLEDGCKFKGSIDMDIEPNAVVTDLKTSYTSSMQKKASEQQAG